MQETSNQAETHMLRGATDRPALLTIRNVVEEMEPLASAVFDDYINPSVLEVELDDGLCSADEARIDITWTTQGDYKFHYTDTDGVDCRWGKHPHAGEYTVPELEHYHPPPNASSDPDEVEASCITQSPEELVTRAVLKLWRVAYHLDSYEALNAGRNPP